MSASNLLRAAAAALSVAIAGCGGSLLQTDRPVADIYVLEPAAKQGETPTLPIDVSIGRPLVTPGLDTERIAVLNGRRLDYYRAARWGGAMAEVMQTFLVDSLHDQQLFRSVTAEQARVASAYVIDIELRDFQAEYTAGRAAPLIRAHMLGRIIRVRDRALIATVAASAEQPAAAQRMNAVAEAFEAAAQRTALDLGRQAHDVISRDRDTAPR